MKDTMVKVSISTLPPHTLPPSMAPHSDSVTPSMCPPRNIRALSWPWTMPGTEAHLACPPGTSGKASWRCQESGTPYWATPSPDLSSCQSLWMDRIILELRKSNMVLVLASELMQYVSANALYGGDVRSAVNAMTIMVEKMGYQVERVPTMEQREAMVMELVQAVTKTASALMSEGNLPAWQDLDTSQRTRFLENMVATLERAASLLPSSLGPDREVSFSSTNLLMTVRRMSFRNIHRVHLPSMASLATPTWRDYQDTVEVPSLVLMENMGAEGAHVIFLSWRHMEELVEVEEGRVVNSQVVHLSFGGEVGKPVVREPLTLTFHHLEEGLVEPRCIVMTEEDGWTDIHCRLVHTNTTHSSCHCSRAGTIALTMQDQPNQGVDRINFLVTIVIAISVSIVIFVSAILALIYCYRLKVTTKLNAV